MRGVGLLEVLSQLVGAASPKSHFTFYFPFDWRIGSHEGEFHYTGENLLQLAGESRRHFDEESPLVSGWTGELPAQGLGGCFVMRLREFHSSACEVEARGDDLWEVTERREQ